MICQWCGHDCDKEIAAGVAAGHVMWGCGCGHETFIPLARGVDGTSHRSGPAEFHCPATGVHVTA